MDHTLSLIQQAHEGDKEAREQLVKENVGLIWCVAKRFFGTRCGGRGSVPDRQHWPFEGD